MKWINMQTIEKDLERVATGSLSTKDFLGLTESDATVLIAFARSLLEKGEIDTAQAFVELALLGNPNSYQGQVLLAEILFQAKQEQAALLALERAKCIQKTARAWFLEAKIKLSLYRYREAAEALHCALQFQTSDALRKDIYICIAETYLHLQQVNQSSVLVG